MGAPPMPPCVKSILKQKRKELYPIAVAFFKQQNYTATNVGQAIGNDLDTVVEILDMLRREDIPAFSCELVKSTDPSLCDENTCPLKKAHDPFEQAKQFIDKVYYVEDDDNLVIVFRGSDKKMVVGYEWALLHPRQFAVRFGANVYKVFRIQFEPVDIDNNTKQVDYTPAKLLVRWLMETAEYMPSSDAYGIGEALLALLRTAEIHTPETARFSDPAEVIAMTKEHSGQNYLYLDVQRVRMMFRALFGPNTSPYSINTKLGRYGIQVRRIQIGGLRKAFYEVSPMAFEELTGMKLAEFLASRGGKDYLEALDNMIRGEGNG